MANKILTIILALAILGVLGAVGYIIESPNAGEKFTEFYILDLEGKAINYPDKLAIGEEGKVIIGIANQKQETTTYRIEVAIDGIRNNEMGIVLLKENERWKGTIGFIPTKEGNNQKVEFLLYEQGEVEVRSRLHLWVDVQR